MSAISIETAVVALKAAVARRARHLREAGTFPAGTRMAVHPWADARLRGIEIRVDVPVIPPRDETARETSRRLDTACRDLKDEFRALLARHQTRTPFHTAVIINRFDGS